MVRYLGLVFEHEESNSNYTYPALRIVMKLRPGIDSISPAFTVSWNQGYHSRMCGSPRFIFTSSTHFFVPKVGTRTD